MTQQDDITQRVLTEAEKDNIYTAWQDRRDEASYGDLIDDVESAVLSKLRAPVADERSALAELLEYVDRNTCTHEDTHRGGAIWTICDGCGMKWADDEGGFVPHQDAPAVAAARAALASAPVADKPAFYINPEVIDHETGDLAAHVDRAITWSREETRAWSLPVYLKPRQASAPVAGEAQPSRQTLLDAIWRHGNARAMAEHNIAYRDEVRNTADALIALFDAAPQASAEYERGHADGWAAGWDQAIKQPQADKDGGQQRAGDAERWRWATATDENAQMLYTIVQAYGGDQQKINERADFYRAALSATQAEQGERDA